MDCTGLIEAKDDGSEFHVETMTLDTFMAQTGRRLVTVQEEISKHLRQQRANRSDVLTAVSDSQRVVNELVGKVRGTELISPKRQLLVDTYGSSNLSHAFRYTGRCAA